MLRVLHREETARKSAPVSHETLAIFRTHTCYFFMPPTRGGRHKFLSAACAAVNRRIMIPHSSVLERSTISAERSEIF